MPRKYPVAPYLLALFGVAAPPLALIFSFWWHLIHGVSVRGFDIGLLFVFYCIGLIGIEVGYHRCFAHRAFAVTSSGARLLSGMGAFAFQGALFWWVAMHRRHHARTDRPGDPHSPNLHDSSLYQRVRAIMWAHYFWSLKRNADPAGPLRAPPVFDLLKQRELWATDKYYGLIAISGILMPGVLGLFYEATLNSVVSAILWGGFLRVFASSNAFMLLNSMGHLLGTRPHRGNDYSRNNGLLAIFTFGQGWHNNHHAHPRVACLRFRPWQIDLGYAVIALLIRLRLAHSPQFIRPAVREENGTSKFHP
jgi:stearoyl-CoA desaturase (delta-9 desaturase)